MSKQIENMDLDSLLAEVSKDVEQMLKSQQEAVATLKKSEESSKEASSKEESSKEASSKVAKKEESSFKKDEASQSAAPAEGSGYESQAPEATDPAAQPGAEQADSIESMISGLDDEMLHEIYQKIKMELQARMGEGSQDQEPAPPMEGPANATPSADAASAPMDMGKSSKEEGEKLAKAESELAKTQKELEELKKTTGMLAEIVEKVISKPVVRAVTDIRSVNYIDKGEGELKKAELTNVSDEDIKKKLSQVTADQKKMATLSKKEHEAILDFYSSKKRSNEILELIK
jgi:hypothetical protein